jgi:hypothetical protein
MTNATVEQKMKRSTWLRISAVVTLLWATGHTLGFPWTPVHNADADAVVGGMRAIKLSVEGTSRTYWDFYQGFGLSITGFLVVQAVILWQLASLAREGARDVRAVTAALFIGSLFNGAIVVRYFFVAPLILVATLVVCLAIALFGRADKPATADAVSQPR